MPEPIFWSASFKKEKNKSLVFVISMNSVQFMNINKKPKVILIVNFFRARSRLEPPFFFAGAGAGVDPIWFQEPEPVPDPPKKEAAPQH